MESDREAANLADEQSPVEPVPAKQPRKRIIGRRAVAGKTSTNGQQDLIPTENRRPPRLLHSVPREILDDPDINAAIASALPSNYNFELHKTIHRVRSSGAKCIALQFPEGLLLFAPTISDIITTFCTGTETIILGDVTYGACCVDDFTARALGADLLIHYGHSCLVPLDRTSKDGMACLYVFVTIGIDVEHLLATIERNFRPSTRMALVGTIQFNNTLHAIIPRLRAMGFDPFLPRSSPLSAGEILGCTAPSLLSSKDRPADSTNSKLANNADVVLYLGDGRFHLEAIMISSPQLRDHTYRYDPYSRRLTHEEYEHGDMHSLRAAAIRSARTTLHNPSATRTPHTWGLILGTLGRQGNPHTLDLIRTHLTKRSIEYITLLLSEVQPQKLARMSETVGVWVQVACPRLSIDWGYAFERPLLSPYEALVALDVRQGDWTKSADANDGSDAQADKPSPEHYPMDYYAKDGLGRTVTGEVLELSMSRLGVDEKPMELEVR